MKTSKAGIDLIKSFESRELKAYLCPGGKWTIGYGHTGPEVREGQKITGPEAEKLLTKDLERFEAAVRDAVTVRLTQNQFDALVSFTFNVGIAAFENSSLLKKLNAGDFTGAANWFPKWAFAMGRKLKGLERRRAAEKAMFEGVA